MAVIRRFWQSGSRTCDLNPPPRGRRPQPPGGNVEVLASQSGAAGPSPVFRSNNNDRLLVVIFFSLILLLGCQPSLRKAAIARQLQDYPETRVQDIYKSFCQDNLGPGHLIPDPAYARDYLTTELTSFREDLDSLRYDAPARMYEPVGDRGNYVRVDLSVVLDGLVSEEMLLDAFVRSANEGRTVSPAFEAAYHPHYRIIAKDIFETELKPLIDR